jgi:shikimate dehydrogenase
MSGVLKAGVMGWPVEHSLSPRLHGYWLHKYTIKGSYIPIAVAPEQMPVALKALPLQGYSGVNLTVPHKEAALQILDHVDPLALRIGAINTVVVHEDGTLEGRNTDAYGFTQNILAAHYKHQNRPAVVLGAGGAARAAIVALLNMGVESVRVLNRTLDKAEALVEEFGEELSVHALEDARALEDASLLVNATSLGLKGQPPLTITLDALPKDALVTDMVYAPLMTDLLISAEARGNKIVDGLGMLLHQARPAFEAFFGVDPEVTPELRRYVLGDA